ncbi:hypothetical protein V8E54_013021 [Elaphomyces granulatus]
MSTVSGLSGRKRGVEDPCYRENNLAANGIFWRSSCNPFPEDIATLVGAISQDRHSPGPSPNEVMHDPELEALEMGTGEPEVGDYFSTNVFTKPGPTDVIKRIEKAPMAKRAVPDLGSKFKLVTPVPDVLYGFNRVHAFTQRQQTLLQLLVAVVLVVKREMNNEMVANSQGLLYPFFSIEYEADGPGGPGSLWSATNQCIGSATASVNIIECLNRRLRMKLTESHRLNSAAFTLAMSGTEARLFISWQAYDQRYFVQKIRSFALQEASQFLQFRAYVLNIIAWGTDTRLQEIRKASPDYYLSHKSEPRPRGSKNDFAFYTCVGIATL